MTLGRVLPGVLLLVVLAARPSSQAVSRIDRLEQWMTAIERHEPGTFDQPAMAVRPWNVDTMRWLWIDLNSVIKLMRDPGTRIFFMFSPGRSRPAQYVYSGSELRRLIALALNEIPARNETDVQRQRVSARGPAPFLRDLSELTGGTLFEVDSTKDLRARFTAILEEFRQRYLVSYSPQGVSKDGWHRLDVRVKGRRAAVKARAGYLASVATPR